MHRRESYWKAEHPVNYAHSHLVEKLRDQRGWYCAELSTSMKVGTDVDQNMLSSVVEGAKAGGHWVAIMAKTNTATSRYLMLS